MRFRPPQPVAPWTDVRNALTFPPAPVQRALPLPGGATITTSEDCLSLNVWTPELSGQHPVMVWIYGGGFEGETVPLVVEPPAEVDHLWRAFWSQQA